jgi:hypothetical protein
MRAVASWEQSRPVVMDCSGMPGRVPKPYEDRCRMPVKLASPTARGKDAGNPALQNVILDLAMTLGEVKDAAWSDS